MLIVQSDSKQILVKHIVSNIKHPKDSKYLQLFFLSKCYLLLISGQVNWSLLRHELCYLVLYLRDNHIQIFHLGLVYRLIYGRKFSFTATEL